MRDHHAYHKFIIVLCVFSILVTTMAFADSLKLRNSWKRYNGQLVKVDDNQIYFQTDQGMLLKLPRTHVSDIRLDAFPSYRSPLPTAAANEGSLTSSSSMYSTTGSVQFPGLNSQPDPQRFTWLAKFKGKSTQTIYAGLYRFPDRGTFWLNLGKSLSQPSRLSFKLYGKWAPKQVPDSFPIAARFLDANNQFIGETPMVLYRGETANLSEWFEYLEGMSGVSTEQVVSWRVPARTQIIELFVPNSKAPNALVGYMSQLVLD